MHCTFRSIVAIPAVAKAIAIAVALWLLLALSPWAPWAPAAHALTTPCTDEQVTVLVEGHPMSCATAGGSGYDVLVEAGFSIEGTVKFPDFICRINSFPSVAVDNCLTTSPDDAYWAYWKAPLGGSDWEYSNLGAFSDFPAAGTVVAWQWGAGERPGEIPAKAASTEVSVTEEEDPLATFNPNDLIIPELEEFPTSATTPAPTPVAPGSPAAAPAAAPVPSPVVNPDNPQEVLVYQDAAGNPITKEQYDALVAAANSGTLAPSAASPTSTSPGTGPGAPASAITSANPTSTLVMQAPAATQTTLSATAPAAATNESEAWMIGLSLAFTTVIGASALGTWVVRRSEIQG
ncbi:oxidoreductase [Corynebacterium callunae]|uniref:oxidoreductase n=1 Tax=Corynebacterium callunae TaxID=1721 RepID=UPI003981B55C